MAPKTYLLQTANGQYSPPLTIETLIGYARNGAIRPETFVYDQAAATWVAAHQIPELRGVFAGTPQTLPSFQTATAVTQPRTPMARGTKWAIGFGLALFLLLCGGGMFGMISVIRKEIEESNKPEVFIGADAAFEVTANGNWTTRTDLNDDADLQIGNTSDDLYLIVLREPKSDFESDDLEQYSAVSRRPLLDSLKNGTESDRRSLKIAGYPAIQYRLEGTSDFVKVKYLHASIATPTHFYQVMGWGTVSDFDRGEEKLQAIISSFKEKPGASK